MYLGATTFHSPEPCHLPLGKLVNGNFKLAEHLVVTQFSYDILGDILMLQTLIYKVFGWYATVNQSAYLIHHTLLKP